MQVGGGSARRRGNRWYLKESKQKGAPKREGTPNCRRAYFKRPLDLALSHLAKRDFSTEFKVDSSIFCL